MMVSTPKGQLAPISAIIADSGTEATQSTPAPDGLVREVEHKEHVFFEGDEREHIYEIVEGVVSVYTVMPDGRRQVISFCYPGTLLGFGHADKYLYNAEALSPVKLRCYPAGALERVAAERPELSQSLMSFMMAELAATRDQLLTLGRKSASEKIASFLLDLSKHNCDVEEDPRVLHLPMTRSDIADYLGLTIETVSRNFTKLRTEGIIDLDHSAKVFVRDMDALEDIASCDEGCF